LHDLGTGLKQLSSRDSDFLTNDSSEVGEFIKSTGVSGIGLMGRHVFGNQSGVAERGGLEERVSGFKGE